MRRLQVLDEAAALRAALLHGVRRVVRAEADPPAVVQVHDRVERDPIADRLGADGKGDDDVEGPNDQLPAKSEEGKIGR